jgi:uncharacterized protein (TIGR04255 family)
MEDLLWDDLIQSAYLGILGEPDVDETTVSKCSLDVEMELGDRCRMKLHAGPGMLKQNTPKGPVAQGETRFILDGDFSASGNLALEQVPAELNTLHSWAVRLFQGAITRELHEAMGPMPL